MLEALSNGSTKGRMVFDFDSLGPFGVLTTARATQMVAHICVSVLYRQPTTNPPVSQQVLDTVQIYTIYD